MPRITKPKTAVAGHGGAVRKPVAKKKSKLYSMPEPIALGTVLSDVSKAQWMVGPSIGTGGFGEIYSACKVGENNYDYVVKCEPHGNGPLFVEMHFYMRNAKLEDIERYKKERGLKKLGMPYMLGNGSHDIKGQKHRFIVMPRYGSDITSFFLKNGRRLPESSIYRLAVQMIDVLEYVHSCGYVHADLKGTNILLGHGREGASQAYLVDYGLASHYTKKDFKPDPKKMHNGTIEYTSRDAHLGVATMRTDLEILGYNLIEWSGVDLPWVRDNLLSSPIKVQQAKNEFMDDVSSGLRKLFSKGAPVPISDFMKYVKTLNFNETPNYEKCRKIFSTALKAMKCPNTGDLDLQIRLPSNYVPAASGRSNRQKTRSNKNLLTSSSPDDDDDVIDASDESEVFEQRKSPRVASRTTTKYKTVHKSPPTKRIAKKRITPSPRKKHEVLSSTATNTADHSPSTSLSPQHVVKPTLPPKSTHRSGSHKITKAIYSPTSRSHTKPHSSPLPSTSNGNSSPPGSGPSTKRGKTVVNDSMAQNPKPGKTYEFNFELDVSMDANVVVNVKRKKKTEAKTSNSTPSSSKKRADAASDESPATRVKMRKLFHTSVKGGSTEKPEIFAKKSKKPVRSPR